jgi:uncharacterized membrane protein
MPLLEGFANMAALAFENTKSTDSKESFSSGGYPVGMMGGQTPMSVLASLIAFFVVILIVAYFGKFLWNNYITKIVSVAKPARSWVDIIALFIFVRLVL